MHKPFYPIRQQTIPSPRGRIWTHTTTNLSAPIHFVTAAVGGWKHLFANEACARIVFDSLDYLGRTRKLALFAFALLPSHLNLLCRPRAGSIRTVVDGFTDFTATRMASVLRRRGRGPLMHYLHARSGGEGHGAPDLGRRADRGSADARKMPLPARTNSQQTGYRAMAPGRNPERIPVFERLLLRSGPRAGDTGDGCAEGVVSPASFRALIYRARKRLGRTLEACFVNELPLSAAKRPRMRLHRSFRALIFRARNRLRRDESRHALWTESHPPSRSTAVRLGMTPRKSHRPLPSLCSGQAGFGSG